MDKTKGNVIKRARLSAGITQEKAAEMSGYSVDAIQAWEAGSRRCSVEVLDLLAVCYGAPWLASIYWRELESESLAQVVPEFTPGKPLAQAALAVIHRLNALGDRGLVTRLAEIAADGLIDDAELPEFEAMLEDLRGLMAAANELKFADTKEGRSHAES